MIVCVHVVRERGVLPLTTTGKCSPIFYSNVAVNVITATVNPIIIFLFFFFELIFALRLVHVLSGKLKAVAT